MADVHPKSDAQETSSPDGREWVCLQHEPLDVAAVLNRVKSPSAGAAVLFVGTTRDNFQGDEVLRLSYTAYTSLALKTLAAIAADVRSEFELEAVAVVHRLGRVDVGVESIVIAVSSPHRQAAWRAGEACLERVKARAEIWKREVFVNGQTQVGGRDGEAGVPAAAQEAEADEGDYDERHGVWRANAERTADGQQTSTTKGDGLEESHPAINDDNDDDKDDTANGRRTTDDGNDNDNNKANDDRGTEEAETYEQHESQHHEQDTDHDGERRRIAEEYRRQMDMELERGWGDA